MHLSAKGARVNPFKGTIDRSHNVKQCQADGTASKFDDVILADQVISMPSKDIPYLIIVSRIKEAFRPRGY